MSPEFSNFVTNSFQSFGLLNYISSSNPVTDRSEIREFYMSPNFKQLVLQAESWANAAYSAEPNNMLYITKVKGQLPQKKVLAETYIYSYFISLIYGIFNDTYKDVPDKWVMYGHGIMFNNLIYGAKSYSTTDGENNLGFSIDIILSTYFGENVTREQFVDKVFKAFPFLLDGATVSLTPGGFMYGHPKYNNLFEQMNTSKNKLRDGADYHTCFCKLDEDNLVSVVVSAEHNPLGNSYITKDFKNFCVIHDIPQNQKYVKNPAIYFCKAVFITSDGVHLMNGNPVYYTVPINSEKDPLIREEVYSITGLYPGTYPIGHNVLVKVTSEYYEEEELTNPFQ